MRTAGNVPVLLWLTALILAGCASRAGDPVAGRQLYFQQKLGASQAPGCITCHSLEPGEVKAGPSHAQIGSLADQRVNAPEYTGQAADAPGYLRESILEPNAHVVEGFEPGLMYQQYDEVLSEQQVEDLVAFLMSLQ